MEERRKLLRQMLVLGMAPAIVRASSLMIIKPSLLPLRQPPPDHDEWSDFNDKGVLYTFSETHYDEFGNGLVVYNSSNKIRSAGPHVTLLPGEERVISMTLYPLGDKRVTALMKRCQERRAPNALCGCA